MFLSCPRRDMYTQTHYDPRLAALTCMIHQIAHISHRMQDRPLNASLQGRLVLVIELLPSYFYDWDVAISCDQLTSTSILTSRQQSTSCSAASFVFPIPATATTSQSLAPCITTLQIIPARHSCQLSIAPSFSKLLSFFFQARSSNYNS
jgi:hypothetical protein